MTRHYKAPPAAPQPNAKCKQWHHSSQDMATKKNFRAMQVHEVNDKAPTPLLHPNPPAKRKQWHHSSQDMAYTHTPLRAMQVHESLA